MRHLLTALLLIVLASTITCHAQDAPETDPEAGAKEAHRRGDHLEELGSAQAGPEQVMTSALAPPEDDSDRWYVNVLMTNNPKYKASCEKLRNEWATSISLIAWGDPDNPKQSWGHVDFKYVEDPLYADWIQKIKDKIEGQAFPIIHIQPPRNKAFGPNTRTIGMVFGWNGDANLLSSRIRAKIKEYSDLCAAGKVRTVSTRRSTGGHAQFVAGAAPTATPILSRNPAEWPDIKAPTLSLTEIRQLCPDASATFLRDQVRAGVSDRQVLELEYLSWLETQGQRINLNPPKTRPLPKPPDVTHDDSQYEGGTETEAKTDTENPTVSISSLDVLIVIAIGIGLLWLIRLLQSLQLGSLTRSRSSSNKREPNESE